MTDPRYFDKSGRIKKGTCYEDAANFVIDNEYARLVHGYHINPDGNKIAHAWAIIPGKGMEDPQVFDTNFGGDRVKKFFPPLADTITHDNLVPIGVYYLLNRNRVIVEYTRDEMLAKMLKHEHYGPWDTESERIWAETEKKVKGEKPSPST